MQSTQSQDIHFGNLTVASQPEQECRLADGIVRYVEIGLSGRAGYCVFPRMRSWFLFLRLSAPWPA